MKVILFLIPFFLIFNRSHAQNDALIKFDTGKEYTQVYVDSLINVLRNSAGKRIELEDFKKILESGEDFYGWSYYYFGEGVTKWRANDNDEALISIDKGINFYNEVESKRKEANIQDLMMLYYYKGDILMENKEYNLAIINHQKALDINKTHPYKYAGVFKQGIAASHYKLGNDSLALKYYLETTHDKIFMQVPRASVIINTRIGHLYEFFGDYDKAEDYYDIALHVSDSTKYNISLASINGSIASLNLIREQPILALQYYKRAIDAFEQYGTGDDAGENDIFFYKAYVKMLENSMDEGIRDMNNLLDSLNVIETKTRNDKKLLLLTVKALGYAYKETQDYNQYQSLIDKTFLFLNAFQKDRSKENIQSLETKYQAKEKDESIQQLKKNEEQQKTIIKQQKTIAYGLSGLILLLFGFGYLFWRQRKLKNQYEKENLEQRLLRSQMNPHFIGNAMNTISALVDKKSEDAIPYINKLSNLFRLVLTNSREEFVNIKDEIATLNSYLELQSNFSNFFKFSIKNTIDKEDYIIPPMLIQPFVENAILHGLKKNSNKSKIEIKITKNDKGLLLCEVDDNGVGYSKTSLIDKKGIHKSISGDIIKERLEILRKKFKVNCRYSISSNNNGTHVEIYLPYLIDT
ncbi:histidine kinase [Pontimicrobium sp. SW4]|uniref:Histidine kinase n=1 Tax=Pontimicrobium sp. SW4 TaxID=3153519 RepID=A0AAU7BU55_9FLAO